MKPFFSFIIIAIYLFSSFVPFSLASDIGIAKKGVSTSDLSGDRIDYPPGDDFLQLKSLIDTSFSPKVGSRYDCIAKNTLCPNYKYTSVVEKAIKLIILKTFPQNEEFYRNLFQGSRYNEAFYDRSGTSSSSLETILAAVPKGTEHLDWRSFGFGNSIGGDLLHASFGVDFSENNNSSSLLRALDLKIQEMKRSKCLSLRGEDCYNMTSISNIYLPTPEELAAQSLYLDRTMIRISQLADQYEYIVDRDPNEGTIDQGSSLTTYTLRYKKETYTLDEAKDELESKNNSQINLVLNSLDGSQLVLPCLSSANSKIRTECLLVSAVVRDIQNGLGAYYSDREVYPDSIDALNSFYVPKDATRQKFIQNFEYNNISTPNQPAYEIRYVGKIEESVESSNLEGTSPGKRDYLALLSGSTVPDIPSIFSHIPSDSMVLYVKDPKNLLDLLTQKKTISNSISGIDASESIKNFILTFFEIDDFETIHLHLKNEMAIVVDNLDATSPEIILVLSESDKSALSSSLKSRVIESKDGYIFVAHSKASLERLTSLKSEKSMKNAPDFQYVWWKKSQKIKDAFVFVGDEFFEKMISLETYLAHYRKYRDYSRLSALQEIVWAYSDAFGSPLTSFTEVSDLGLSELSLDVLKEYSIVDGIVIHKNIGSLNSLKTLSEAQYNFDSITRFELDDYKTNVLKYREVWRTSLDPMGIVLNRYGDGLEIDFFMTPVPYFDDPDLREIQEFFSSATKDSLSFLENANIRKGILSFIFGFDVEKFQQSINSQKDLRSEFEEFSREVLDGKNIFDYLAGEFAFTVGSIDPDILDGWNIEKIDVYLSVQVKSQDKGKELIDIIRTKILSELGEQSNDEADLIRGFLAKPLIEDYKDNKIYYVEGLPIPFVGKIGFAYTFIDDFFFLGLNRTTVRNIIDTATSGDKNKFNNLTRKSLSSGTLFAAVFDGINASTQLEGLYEKNKTSIPRYLRYIDREFSTHRTLQEVFSIHYVEADRATRLGKDIKPFESTYGVLVLKGNGSDVYAYIDKDRISLLSGTTLQSWENIKSDPDFPQDILTKNGIQSEKLLSYKNVNELLAFVFISHLDIIFQSNEVLLKNFTFGLNLGDDEIGFDLRIFRNLDQNSDEFTIGSNNNALIFYTVFGVLIFLGALSFGIFLRRRSQNHLPGASLQGGEVPVGSINTSRAGYISVEKSEDANK